MNNPDFSSRKVKMTPPPVLTLKSLKTSHPTNACYWVQYQKKKLKNRFKENKKGVDFEAKMTHFLNFRQDKKFP